MAIQAIIMAGGEGVRLRPLTVHRPKPLVPLLGEPVMGYAMKLLRRHGCRRIGATLWYQPEKIREAFGAGDAYHMRLSYYEETVPMGTAGSIKLAGKELTEPFFVLSGDGLTDCDLSGAMRFHREKGALATLVLKRVSIPLPYGVVMTDGSGRITQFIEKPGWSRVFSDLVNTGVYILDPAILNHIPDEGMPDFGKDIFPALLAKGLPLYGYETEGYWCDVGDQRAYLAAQRDLLLGKVNLPCASGIHPDARVDPGARIDGRCCIGPETVIGPGAQIRNAVIGKGCVIGRGAVVENACLWDGAAVMDKARAVGCVLCDGAVARQGAEISDGCALGAGAVAGAFAMLRPGVRIGPHLKAAPGAVASRNILSGDWCAPQWSPRGAECDSPECVCALCEAFVQAVGCRRVLTGGSGDTPAQAIADGALAACGAQALSGGDMTEPMLWALIGELQADGGVFVQGQTLSFFDREGEPLSAGQKSAMEQQILRQDAPPLFSRPGEIVHLTGAEEIYLARILPPGNPKPLWSPVAIFSDQPLLLRLAREGLSRMNARDARAVPNRDISLRAGETGILLSERGDDMTVMTEAGALSPEERQMLVLSLCLREQKTLFDLPGVPRAAEQLAPLQKPDGSRACAWQRSLMRDGLAAALLLCGAMKNGPVSALMEGLPETHILSRDVECPIQEKGRVLHALCDRITLPHTLEEGVRIRHEKGFATIVPDAHRSAVRITSESGDSEFARELCDFYLRQVEDITKIKNNCATP